MMLCNKKNLSLCGTTVLLILSALSCCRLLDDSMEPRTVNLRDVNIPTLTKTNEGEEYTDMTFRFCLFNATSYNFSGFEGTYCLPNPMKDPRWLTPCKVDGNTGEYDSADPDPEATIHGLQARNGTYYMAIASPAVSMQSPKKDIYGFYYDRERVPGEKPLCISDSIKVVVSGTSMDGSNLYFVNDTIRLKERRSRIKLSVSCGDDIESAIVKELRLSNILSKGYYLPMDEAFEYEDSYLCETTVETFSPAIILYKEDDSESGRAKHHQCTVEPWVLSMDYSKVDEYSRPVFPLPEIVVAIGEDDGMTVRIPIAYNLLPESIYRCHITINSCFVEVRLSVLEWEGPNDVSGDNASFLQRPLTLTVPIWENGTQGTSGDTEIHDSEW